MDGHVDGHGPGDTRRHHPRTAVHQTAQPTFLSDSRQSLSRVKFIFFFFKKKKKKFKLFIHFLNIVEMFGVNVLGIVWCFF